MSRFFCLNLFKSIFSKKGWNSQHQQRMNDSAIVSLRYWTTEHTIHEYSPLFTVLDMVCYVGGLVSMYTGVSLIAIFDFFAFVYYFTLKHTK